MAIANAVLEAAAGPTAGSRGSSFPVVVLVVLVVRLPATPAGEVLIALALSGAGVFALVRSQPTHTRARAQRKHSATHEVHTMALFVRWCGGGSHASARVCVLINTHALAADGGTDRENGALLFQLF